jgi:hypothetical protein
MVRKNYSKTGEFCRVTFELPPEVNAGEISLCGEFNDWNPQKNIMIKRKNGKWSTTISLMAGKNTDTNTCWTAKAGRMTGMPMHIREMS